MYFHFVVSTGVIYILKSAQEKQINEKAFFHKADKTKSLTPEKKSAIPDLDSLMHNAARWHDR